MNLPTFAILGHPNEGKSSVVSTLVEDESVVVSPTPGETRRLRTYTITLHSQDHLRFIDTPGFQNPSAVLAWFQAFPGPENHIVPAFINAHQHQQRFHHDVELLRPLADRAGILYVADASRPLRDVDRKEMEILRLTGLPRLALLNLKRHEASFLDAWRDALGRRFNILREFNAHHATFSERLQLLEALKILNQDWEAPLANLIREIRRDHQQRIEESALVLESLLHDALHHVHHLTLKPGDSPQNRKNDAIEAYRQDLRKRENRARNEWRRIHRHTALPDTPPDTLYTEDLFAEHVWRLLGLTRRQLATAGAFTGGLLGAGGDLAAGGLTFGILTAGGAALGALGGWRGGGALGAKRLPLPGKRTFARETLQVGPIRDPQLLYVLIDRSLLYLTRLMNRAHGRRDHQTFLESLSTSQGFVAHWPPESRNLLLRWFNQQRKNRPDPQTTHDLRILLANAITGKHHPA